jgi:ABC-2 type transport system ATP-binding protein
MQITDNKSYAVRVEGLLKRFKDFVAVDGISFSVRHGEIFGFLGPNGAGKSTTIRMLCGLLPPSEGGAWIGELDLATQSELIKQKIGYMSQKFSLYDDLTVEQNINFFSGIYGVPRSKRPERKRYVLSMAGLEEKRTTLTRMLSGGWKQRLALGCSILHEPDILFLDEPTSGVDPIARRMFWHLIHRLSGSGHTVFVSTHYMDEAEFCHRVALMHGGRIIAAGAPAELKSNLHSRKFLALDSSDPIESMKILEHSEGICEIAAFGSGLHIIVEDPDRAVPQIRDALDRVGIVIRRIEVIAPSMEDVFVALIEDKERAAS